MIFLVDKGNLLATIFVQILEYQLLLVVTARYHSFEELFPQFSENDILRLLRFLQTHAVHAFGRFVALFGVDLHVVQQVLWKLVWWLYSVFFLLDGLLNDSCSFLVLQQLF